MFLFAATASDLASSAPLNHTTNKTETTTEELFEGDIVISEEMIRQYYNITDFEHKMGKTFRFHMREKRAATSVSSLLWPNGVVYYTFDTNLPIDVANTVRTAMNNFEDKTCLRFVKNSSGNYIKIKAQANRGCSSYVGMRGGEQILNLKYPGCNSVGIAEHEIGHAIGFWHEQSRPDRDSYVTIVSENIRPETQYNFMKRTNVDSLGVGYDYGSIMHYSTYVFSTGGPTIQVNNQNEYRSQGSPTLGQQNGLSARDIQQVNYLYKCHGFGITGRLIIKVRNGVNLPDTDLWLNSPDLYVKITAVHTLMVTRQTSEKSGTQNLTWNELLDFGIHQWKYFRVRIWDKDFLTFPMSNSESIALTSIGSRKNVKHCTNPSCSGHLWLDYYLYPNGWSGDNCTHRWANLRFFVRYGRDLPDKDGWLNKSINPYVEIIAYNAEGSSVRRITSWKQEDQSPDWNQNLYFGTDAWKMFKIRAWDKDLDADDPLSHQWTLTVQPGSHVRMRFNCYSGYIVYDYHF